MSVCYNKNVRLRDYRKEPREMTITTNTNGIQQQQDGEFTYYGFSLQ
jgi:hypothetical protein